MTDAHPTDTGPRTPDSDDLVERRADQLTSEEQQAGVDDPRGLAAAVLGDSEERIAHREATAVEHRRSEDTVEIMD